MMFNNLIAFHPKVSEREIAAQTWGDALSAAKRTCKAWSTLYTCECVCSPCRATLMKTY